MFNPTLSTFLFKLKFYIIKLIERYTSDYLNKQIKLSNKKDVQEILNLFEEYNPNFNEEFCRDFLEKRENIEINKSIDILLALFNMKDNKKMTFFQSRLIKSVLKEIKLFRNLFSKDDKNISDEIIQRFFENVYFLFKYIKPPKSSMDIFEYDDSFQDEITFQIQNSLLVNTRKYNSFKLNYARSEDILKDLDKPVINDYEEEIKLKKIFEDKIDLTLLAKEKHEVDLLNNEIKLNEDKNLRIFIEKDRYDNSRSRKNLNNSLSSRSGNTGSLKIGMQTFSNDSKNNIGSVNNENEKEKPREPKDKTINSNISLSLGDTNNFESDISINNSNRYSLNDESDL